MVFSTFKIIDAKVFVGKQYPKFFYYKQQIGLLNDTNNMMVIFFKTSMRILNGLKLVCFISYCFILSRLKHT